MLSVVNTPQSSNTTTSIRLASTTDRKVWQSVTGGLPLPKSVSSLRKGLSDGMRDAQSPDACPAQRLNALIFGQDMLDRADEVQSPLVPTGQ